MQRWVIVAVVGTGSVIVGASAAVALIGGNHHEGEVAPAAGAFVPAASARAPAPHPAKHSSAPHMAKPSSRPAEAVRPAVRPSPTSDPIPILMYHVVADPPDGAPYPGLYVSRADFAGQVAWLAGHGYHAVTLRAAYHHWRLGLVLPPRPVVLTFDDGYRSHFVNAAPILSRRGWPGVLNLEVRNTTQSWGLSPRQIRLLVADGWEVAAHTLTHPDLTQVDADTLEHEVAGSRVRLRRMFHVPVDFFCYPSGRLDDRVVAAVEAAGYAGATTTEYGLARPADMFRLARVRVDRSDGVEGFAAKLRALGSTP